MVTYFRKIPAIRLSQLLWLGLICLPFCMHAQPVVTLSGYVEDAESGERLAGVRLYDWISKQEALSNEYGFFSLRTQGDSARVYAALGGYEPCDTLLPVSRQQLVVVTLKSYYAIDPVKIVAEQGARIHEQTEMSTVQIPVDQIQSLPALGGEPDVLKALQLMPGVQSGNEGSAGIYVRGGGPDQNLILLDGAPLYNVSHIGGYFSVFNVHALQEVTLIKGGFPARYGGRISSIFDIRMKEGNRQRVQGEAGIGLAAAHFSLEGPWQKGKGSFIVSARRTYFDLLLRPVISLATAGEAALGYAFYDLNAKINYRISPKDQVYLSLYTGNDRLATRFNSTDDLGSINLSSRFDSRVAWGNQLLAFRWNRAWNPKLFTKWAVNYTRYRFLTGVKSQTRENSGGQTERTSSALRFLSQITDASVSFDGDYYLHPRF